MPGFFILHNIQWPDSVVFRQIKLTHTNMTNYILFDDLGRDRLFPFTRTRPTADIRCGIFTNRERWEFFFKQTTSTLTHESLAGVYPIQVGPDQIFLNGAWLATPGLLKQVLSLDSGSCIMAGGNVVAIRTHIAVSAYDELEKVAAASTVTQFTESLRRIEHSWDIFRLNGPQIVADFELLTSGRKSAPLPASVMCSGLEHIFLEEGAEIGLGSIINASKGPVYIGKNAHILEGVMIHGPLAVCSDAIIKMGAKLYGDTTIGPGCRAGGEINNSVLFANSNKGHDGYLGNSVLGEWCNLGADTNTSNLKNNYDTVKVHSEKTGKLESTGLTFCGLLMGDHSKSGINTMFNTGTVVGVSANIFGGGFPPKFIPSFSWGGAEGLETYQFDKAMETATRVMERRKKRPSDAETALYQYIFNHTKDQRK